jgi:hypothetical protein
VFFVLKSAVLVEGGRRYGYGRWEGVKIVEDRLYVLEVVRK